MLRYWTKNYSVNVHKLISLDNKNSSKELGVDLHQSTK